VIDQSVKDGQQFAEMYENPLINAAFTVLEPSPAWLAVALSSAGVLREQRVSLSIPSGSRAGIPR
jgi:hypothetical protein